MLTLGIIGIFCLVYYLACALYSGFGSSYLWIWLAGGLLCVTGALFLYYMKKQHTDWSMPTAAKIILLVGLLVVFIIFSAVETRIIANMGDGGKPELDYVIVLGAQVKQNHPSKALQHRIDRAFEYLSDNPGTVAVLSGGKGPDEPVTEASSMAASLVGKGISADRLILEEKSTNTDENFKYSIELIESPDADIGVITSNFHVYRAIAIGEKQSGRKLCGIPAPSCDIMQLHYMVREFLAILKDTLTGHMNW